MRPFRNGKGSYELIVPKFQKFAKSRGEKDYFVRGTFTRNNLPVSAGSMIFGIVASVVIALIYQFFVFAVDYTRTEYLQYEDDDYYYYVKAVPKLTVSAPDVKVQRIYSRKNVRHEKNETRE